MLDDPGAWRAPAGALPASAAAALKGPGIAQRLRLLRLPVMPEVLSRLLDACQSDGASADELAAIAGLDAGIAARVIALASSSQSDERHLFSNLAQCVAMVGADVVRAVAADAWSARVFGASCRAEESALARHWRHTLKCALLARELAVAMDYPDTAEAYLAGLLHDLGSLALLALDPREYARLWDAGLEDEHLCLQEQERYRVTHAEAGAWLAETWQLGPFLADSMLYHHAPAERLATAHPLIRIVALAHHLAQTDRFANLAGALEFARLCGAPADCVFPSLERADAELQSLTHGLGMPPAADVAMAPPPSDLPDERNPGIGALQARLEGKLQLDAVRGLLEGAANPDALLQAVAQGLMILFGLGPSVFFLREGEGAAFVGRALHTRHAKVNQLSFFAGQSASALATATLGTPVVWAAGDTWRQPLDAQVVRLLEAEAFVCIPLGAGARCRALVAAAIHTHRDAGLLPGRIDALRAFGRIAEAALERVLAPPPGDEQSRAQDHAAGGASAEQIRQLIHEIGTPLSIVRNYLATLQISLGQNAIGDKELQIVTEEIARVMKLLDQFQRAPQNVQDVQNVASAAGPAELHELLAGILDLCRGAGLVPAMVNIETDFQTFAPVPVADPDKLKQVLLNLMKNAFEAMPDGGMFRLSTSWWNDGGGGNSSGGEQVEIALQDSGPGLPDEVLRNIYRPVASTKGDQHFGIGLSIAGQLVSEMNGRISCRSTRSGCCFRIILPLGAS
ncbi:MAG: histidine kinase [Betaproteobacteria bacterium]|nr:histidine kinase [Betaproteobacteria bacterium]